MKKIKSQVTGHRSQANSLLLITCFLALGFLSACAKREIKNTDSEGKNIICFGDSVTFGYGAGPGEDYPTALAKLVSLPIINAGIDGDTTTEGLKRLQSDILDRDPFLVIVEFAGNDFLRKVPKAVTVSNVEKMVEVIQESGAMVAIVDISAGMVLNEYSADFCRIAKEKGAIFVPKAFRGIITNPNLKSDFIHPNAKGYQLIAERIYRAILPYLNKNLRK